MTIKKDLNYSKGQLLLLVSLHKRLIKSWEEVATKAQRRDICIDKLNTIMARLDQKISDKHASAKHYLQIADRYESLIAQIKSSQNEIKKFDERMFAEIKNLHRPPSALQHVIIGCMFLVG